MAFLYMRLSVPAVLVCKHAYVLLNFLLRHKDAAQAAGRVPLPAHVGDGLLSA